MTSEMSSHTNTLGTDMHAQPHRGESKVLWAMMMMMITGMLIIMAEGYALLCQGSG